MWYVVSVFLSYARNSTIINYNVTHNTDAMSHTESDKLSSAGRQSNITHSSIINHRRECGGWANYELRKLVFVCSKVLIVRL